MTLLLPWGRDRDRLERAAAVGAQRLLRAFTASSYHAFFLLKRKTPMKEMERLIEMALGGFKCRSSHFTAVGREKERRQ